MARPVRIRRKDLRRPDEFLTLTGQAVQWARANQRTLTWVGAGIAAVVLGVVGYLAIQSAQQRDANADLARALNAYRQPKSTDAATQLAEVANRWGKTPAGEMAKLLAASAELRRDNTDTAIAALQEILTIQKWPPYLKQQALLAYGFALETKGQRQEALAKYSEAAGIEGPYTAQVLLAQARCHEALGEGAAAQEIYQRIKKDFPDVAEKEQIGAKIRG